jgi:hypothetical protein
MARCDATGEDFREAAILGRPALFTCIRIERSTVPRGYHLYEVRHGDECQGDAVQIARGIVVNHLGTLITRDRIKLPPSGYLDIGPDDLDYGTGSCLTLKGFMEKYPPRARPPKSHER